MNPYSYYLYIIVLYRQDEFAARNLKKPDHFLIKQWTSTSHFCKPADCLVKGLTEPLESLELDPPALQHHPHNTLYKHLY